MSENDMISEVSNILSTLCKHSINIKNEYKIYIEEYSLTNFLTYSNKYRKR